MYMKSKLGRTYLGPEAGSAHFGRHSVQSDFNLRRLTPSVNPLSSGCLHCNNVQRAISKISTIYVANVGGYRTEMNTIAFAAVSEIRPKIRRNRMENRT